MIDAEPGTDQHQQEQARGRKARRAGAGGKRKADHAENDRRIPWPALQQAKRAGGELQNQLEEPCASKRGDGGGERSGNGGPR